MQAGSNTCNNSGRLPPPHEIRAEMMKSNCVRFAKSCVPLLRPMLNIRASNVGAEAEAVKL
jgi:hypothetical protein